jgi:hypothetical protein
MFLALKTRRLPKRGMTLLSTLVAIAILLGGILLVQARLISETMQLKRVLQIYQNELAPNDLSTVLRPMLLDMLQNGEPDLYDEAVTYDGNRFLVSIRFEETVAFLEVKKNALSDE